MLKELFCAHERLALERLDVHLHDERRAECEHRPKVVERDGRHALIIDARDGLRALHTTLHTVGLLRMGSEYVVFILNTVRSGRV